MFIVAGSCTCTVRRLRPALDRELSPRARAAAAQNAASPARASRPRRLCWPAQGVFDRINCCFDQAACECRREGPGALSGRVALTVLMAPAHSPEVAAMRGWVVLAAGSEAARSRARPLASGLRAWSPGPSSAPNCGRRRANYRRARLYMDRTRTVHACPASPAREQPYQSRCSAAEGRVNCRLAIDIPIQMAKWAGVFSQGV